MYRVVLSVVIFVSLTGVLAEHNEEVENIIKLYESKMSSVDCKKPELKKDEIHFNFYTRERYLFNLTLKDIAHEDFLATHYHTNKVTKIIVHGWHGYASMEPFQRMVVDYLHTQDVNVISMDWSVYARTCNLKSVFRDVTTVSGEILGDLLKLLMSRNAKPIKFHVIAFGVGSHIAAVAGKMVHPELIGRITALEPMGLHFDYPEYPKLETTDAQLVDVIYTTKDHSSHRDFGHIVFYPEGGYHPQPECENAEEMCSSYKSISYFRRSIITPYAYPAKRIVSALKDSRPEHEGAGSTYTPDNYMGEYVEPSKHGHYYVNVKGLPLHTLRHDVN